MIRSMLCALVMFMGVIIAPTSAYPTGKVVEVTEADFDAQVRPRGVIVAPRPGMTGSRQGICPARPPVRSLTAPRAPSPFARAGSERTDAGGRLRGLVWT